MDRPERQRRIIFGENNEVVQIIIDGIVIPSCGGVPERRGGFSSSQAGRTLSKTLDHSGRASRVSSAWKIIVLFFRTLEKVAPADAVGFQALETQGRIYHLVIHLLLFTRRQPNNPIAPKKSSSTLEGSGTGSPVVAPIQSHSLLSATPPPMSPNSPPYPSVKVFTPTSEFPTNNVPPSAPSATKEQKPIRNSFRYP